MCVLSLVGSAEKPYFVLQYCYWHRAVISLHKHVSKVRWVTRSAPETARGDRLYLLTRPETHKRNAEPEHLSLKYSAFSKSSFK